MSRPTPFHRLFGYAWMDLLDGTDVTVETELDLSIRMQLLDVVIVRTGSGPLPRRLPDGFEELAPHNLVTFKSHQQALDARAIHELVGHYINYCKRVSPSLSALLPASDFRLFAVSARHPDGLAREMALSPVAAGVYDGVGFGLTVRVVVANELPLAQHNAILHLFSASQELIQFGRDHYRPQEGASTILNLLFGAYREDPTMSEKLKEFLDRSIAELLKSLPAEERLKGVSAEELLRALPPETLEALKKRIRDEGLPHPPEGS